ILSLSLAQGGHLTHGSPVNFSGKLFEIHHYGLDPKTETIDYAAALKLAREIRPRCILGGASAYPRTLDFVRLREIAEDVGAMMICDIAHIAGLVAVGLHPSPVPISDAVTTTTHKTLRGPRSGLILCKQQHAKAVDSNVFPGIQGGPLEHIIAAKAVAFGEAQRPAPRHARSHHAGNGSFGDAYRREADRARARRAGRRGRAGEGPRRSARALPPVPALREEARTARMKCPFCAELENKVIDSRLSNQGAVIRRRRECLGCERRFTTYERVEEILPMVVKKD